MKFKSENLLFGLTVLLGIIGIVGLIISIEDNMINSWATFIISAISTAISLALIKNSFEED